MQASSPDPPPRLRVAFVLPEVLGGGAERSMLSIIGVLDRAAFDPLLVLFDKRVDHETPPDLPVIVLQRRGLGGVGRLLSRARQLAALARDQHIDLLVSFLIGPNVVAVAAGRLAGVPVVIGERSAPHHVLAVSNRALTAHALWSRLVRWTYPRADAIVANTAGAKRELVAMTGVAPERVAVIRNPIDADRIRALAAEPAPEMADDGRGPAIVHVGRFSYAKDHDTLLHAFALVRSRRPARLFLVGDGEDEARVRATTRALNLEADVTFVGFTRNPYKYLARASVSVLTSRFEGMPNALVESMVLGTPVVSTACEYGPTELLGGNECGVLVPVGDAAAVAHGIESVLDDPALRERLRTAGAAAVRPFERDRVAAEYTELLRRAVRRQPVAV